MEISVPGEVVCIKVPYPRSVKRFVQKRISQWITKQAGAARRIKDVFFFVKFERLGDGHDVSCSIQVFAGQQCWRGTALADGLHKSLIFSLEHLVPHFERPVAEIKPHIA